MIGSGLRSAGAKTHTIAVVGAMLVSLYADCALARDFFPDATYISPSSSDDKYGFSVGYGSGVLAVGAPFSFGATTAYGRVYLGGSPLGATPADVQNTGFGTDVATNGTLLVSGKWRPWNGQSSGQYEVHTRTGGTWTKIGELAGVPRARIDDDGTLVLAGGIYTSSLTRLGDSGGLRAEKEGDRSVGCDSEVRVVERTGLGDWVQVNSFVPGPAGTPTGSCGDIAYSDGDVAVFVPSTQVVYVHSRDSGGDGGWGHVATFNVGRSSDIRVELDRGRLVIGEWSANARLFHRNLGGINNWGIVGTIRAPEGSFPLEFPFDMDMQGDILVASRMHPANLGATRGTVFRFNLKATDLSLAIGAPPTAVAGEILEYTVLVRNDGPSIADAVAATVPIPIQLSAVAVDGCPGGTTPLLQCNLGALAPGSTKSIRVRGRIDPFFRGTINLTATSRMATVETSPGNESSSVNVSVSGIADVSVSKTDGRASIAPGQSTTYSIAISNAGPSGSAIVPFSDSFQSPFTSCTWAASASGGATGHFAGAGPSITSNLRMPPLSSVVYTVGCPVPPAARGELVNSASVGSDLEDPDQNDRVASDITQLSPLSDHQISKSDGLVEIPFESQVEYVIDVLNAGPSGPDAVQITDNFPPELTEVTWTCEAAVGSTCEFSSGTTQTIAAELGAQSGVVIRLRGLVSNPKDRLIVNTAIVQSTTGIPDPLTGNNFSTDETQIVMPDGIFSDGFE